MKKIFLIALFMMGLTATVKAQCIGTPSCNSNFPGLFISPIIGGETYEITVDMSPGINAIYIDNKNTKDHYYTVLTYSSNTGFWTGTATSTTTSSTFEVLIETDNNNYVILYSICKS